MAPKSGKVVSVDSWETAEDLRALQRVAEINKSPARKKACQDAIKGAAAAMGCDMGGKSKK